MASQFVLGAIIRWGKLLDQIYVAIGATGEATAVFGLAFGAKHGTATVYYKVPIRTTNLQWATRR
jgi:hypothetical protein